MSNSPEIAVSLTISVMDTPIKGTIFLLTWKGDKASICHCRGKISPVFTGGDETSLYQDCREWFMDHFDGFVKVAKNDDADAEKACRLFDDIKKSISEFN